MIAFKILIHEVSKDNRFRCQCSFQNNISVWLPPLQQLNLQLLLTENSRKVISIFTLQFLIVVVGMIFTMIFLSRKICACCASIRISCPKYSFLHLTLFSRREIKSLSSSSVKNNSDFRITGEIYAVFKLNKLTKCV